MNMEQLHLSDVFEGTIRGILVPVGEALVVRQQFYLGALTAAIMVCQGRSDDLARELDEFLGEGKDHD